LINQPAERSRRQTPIDGPPNGGEQRRSKGVAMRKYFGTIALALALTAGFAPRASADEYLTQAERANLAVFKDVSNQVLQYVNFTVFDDISASVENGIVTLEGHVTMPYKKEDIARRVARVNGVNVVQNKIQVLPVSIFDDELRYRVARAIYGNSAFWHYANMAQPPIHIVVKNGHVTLAGVVQSNVERALARSLATGLGAFDVTNALKTDDEMKTELEKI
jgi:hyperosmotically inducible protein